MRIAFILQHNTVKEALRYALVGVANTIVGFGAITLLTYWNVYYIAANSIGTFVGLLCSFALNRNFTFRCTFRGANNQQGRTKNSKHIALQFLYFLLGCSVSFIFGLIVVTLLVEWAGIPALWSSRELYGGEKMGYIVCQAASALAYTGSGFVINKFWVFRKVR